MSKKKGLSLDEKREKMLEIFHETKDVFVLKDIEKLAVKKGITLQTVKEVLTSLVDDSLVHQERIGASNFFWSFPSEAANQLTVEHEKLKARLATAEKQHTQLATQLEEAQCGREDTEERAAAMQVMTALEQELMALHQTLQQYADNDPQKHAAIANGVEVAREAANRWLDNIEALRDWAKKQFEGREADVDAFFEQAGFKADWEYIEA